MNKKAMVGVIAAVTISVGGGAALAGYVMHHSHKKADSIGTTIKKSVSAQMADVVSAKITASMAETEKLLAQKNAEKAVAEQEAFAKMEAQNATVNQQSVIEYLAGSPVYPETMEVGTMAGDCVSDITNLMGGSTAGDEYELKADQPVLYTLKEDGSFELVDFYEPLEAGVKYFTKIDVHCEEKAFAENVKLGDSLEEWHIAAVKGNTVTLCSPVIMPCCGAC